MRVLTFLLLASPTASLVLRSPRVSSVPGASPLVRLRSAPPAAASEGTTPAATAESGGGGALLPRERYVATNRFTVRDGKAAAFEKRWATRKSRLASLEGFKYFHLMRRVQLDPATDAPFEDDFNYVSFTIWEEKKHFNAWRQGDAFKEAHGGNSLTDFIGAMVSSALVLKGAPRPAFYDGLLLQGTVPEVVPETVDGWRQVVADGVNCLPAEAFVACNQFFVPAANAAAFEQRWASRESALKTCDGFVAFSMLRRDGKAKGHGVAPVDEKECAYQSTTIWRDRAAFEAWRGGMAFKQAHGQGGKPAGPPGAAGAGKPGGKPEGAPPAPLWSRPPLPQFYEATLVISSPSGV